MNDLAQSAKQSRNYFTLFEQGALDKELLQL